LYLNNHSQLFIKSKRVKTAVFHSDASSFCSHLSLLIKDSGTPVHTLKTTWFHVIKIVASKLSNVGTTIKCQSTRFFWWTFGGMHNTCKRDKKHPTYIPLKWCFQTRTLVVDLWTIPFTIVHGEILWIFKTINPNSPTLKTIWCL